MALRFLGELLNRLGAAGVTEPGDRAVVRSLLSGIAAEQIANDPHGHLFTDQTERAVRAILAAIGPTAPPGARPRP